MEKNEFDGKSKGILKLALVFCVAALVFSSFAHAAFNVTAIQSDLESSFRIAEVDQVPDRVYPGDEVAFKMMLSTTETQGVSGVVFTIITPFDTTTSTTTINQLSAGDKNPVSRTFTVPVGTKPGTYLIYVYASATNIPQQEVARIPLVVYEPSVTNLLLAQASYEKSVSTGSSVQIMVNVTNTGAVDAEDVTTQLVLNTSSPFTALEYDRKYTQRIKAGETVQVPFLIGVNADATPGFYPLTVNIAYSVDNAAQPAIQQNLGLKVEANPQLLITSDFGAGSTTSASTGGMLLTITIANVGDTAVRGVYIKASSDSFRIVGASDKFIGTLNLDDSSTMSLTLAQRARTGNASSGAAAGAAGEPSVTVLLSYKDPLNQERTLTQVIPVSSDGTTAAGVQVTSSGGQRFITRQQDQGFLGLSWIIWGGIAVLLVAGVGGYWWFKKRKKKNAAALEEARHGKK